MKNIVLIVSVVAGCFGCTTVVGAEFDQKWLDRELPRLLEIYQTLHAAPELSHAEVKTAALFAARLQKSGVEVTTGVGGHGVVGILRNGESPVIMLRADLDALPVTEATNLPFASKVQVRTAEGVTTGVMHACGHDIHMTNLLGVADYLAKHRELWRGVIMFVGQPAEERGEGARKMLADGLFTRFAKPDFAIALHVDAELPAGKIGYRAGYSLANVDSVDIQVRGKGGHGAYPHKTVDPVVQAAALIMDLQTIASRERAPIEPVVVTVGSIQGGTKHNIISDSCKLQLTVRTTSAASREQVLKAIRRKANAIAASFDAPAPIIDVSEGTPALFNDEKLVARLTPVLKNQLGDDNVVESPLSMGGEDFSQYGLAGVPICMFKLGSVARDRLESFQKRNLEPPSLHSPFYYPDAEPTLAVGVRTMASIAIELAPSGSK